jgi:hypothetical protein
MSTAVHRSPSKLRRTNSIFNLLYSYMVPMRSLRLDCTCATFGPFSVRKGSKKLKVWATQIILNWMGACGASVIYSLLGLKMSFSLYYSEGSLCVLGTLWISANPHWVTYFTIGPFFSLIDVVQRRLLLPRRRAEVRSLDLLCSVCCRQVH